jgi:hypothetical protein
MILDHATPDLFAALAVAQAEVENATKNAANPHFRSSYADLAEVLNTVRPVFAKAGIGIVQSTSFDGSMVTVDTVLTHKSGGYITSRASCIPAKSDAQGVGSATTYLRRYSLAAMAGVAQEDDDGNSSAHGRPPAAKPLAKAEPKQDKPTVDQLKALSTLATDILNCTTLDDLEALRPRIRELPESLKKTALENAKARADAIRAEGEDGEKEE